MGECGCSCGNMAFKLKAPDGWYVIEFLPGCNYCHHGPGIQISHPEATKYIDDINEMDVLPVIGNGEHCISMIKCGLDPSEAKEAAVRCFGNTPMDGEDIDEIMAEILGEDFWKDAMTGSPKVIYPREDDSDLEKIQGV